jgi:polysaccharide export outer membrane protein
MSKCLNQRIVIWRNSLEQPHLLQNAPSYFGILTSLFLLLGSATACKTAQYTNVAQNVAANTNQMVLQEGDSLKISFPGAPNLNTDVRIRLDGIISLPVVGDVKAAGRTPAELEQELLKLYGPQLQTKEVSVTVVSSALYVYVTGAVLRPGKITSDHPMTALDAIMEAGGFDYTKANLKKVTVIRHEHGKTEHHILDLKRVLRGHQDQPFELNRADIIYVPERFAWF